MLGLKRLGQCSELEMEKILGNLLRTGVILSAIVVLVGLGLHFVTADSPSPDYRIFRGESADLHTVRGIWRDAVELKGSGVIQLGLLLLLATPIARVVLSMLAFACQRDRVYVLVTIIVLSGLAYSLMGNPR